MSGGNEAPIGVFDSGIGGLTVVRALRRLLPSESVVYLGDTARVPYGTKSPETVIRYSLNNARFLLGRGVKMLVVACNTASSTALGAMREHFTGIPVIGMVEPGAQAAVLASKSGSIGVIGTRATIESRSYERALRQFGGPSVIMDGEPCPLFVSLAEEGIVDGPIVDLVARRYLERLVSRLPDMDTLILGCTHYPLLSSAIHATVEDLAGHEVTLIDSGESAARVVSDVLDSRGIRSTRNDRGELTVYVTDTSHIREVGSRFLGEELGDIRKVDI